MLIKILIAVALLLVVFVIVVASRPSDFRVTRTAPIPASPPVVFAHVNELKKWPEWSPWARMDPTAKSTFEGPIAGKGAIFKWAGNNKVGEGQMTITESRPSELVRFKLDFLKPFEASNTAEFTFEPKGNDTFITWSMAGKNNFMFKAVGLFMNCDKMVGSQFEEGLNNLKTVVTSTAVK